MQRCQIDAVIDVQEDLVFETAFRMNHFFKEHSSDAGEFEKLHILGIKRRFRKGFRIETAWRNVINLISLLLRHFKSIFQI